MGRVKIGLMGCGTVAGYGHLPAIVATPGLELAALFDPDRSRLDATGERFSIPPEKRFTDQSAFFAAKLDAVSVTSPAPFHYDNVLAAAEAGCHVLCEKPLAESEADGWKMVDAMKRAKKHLFVGFIYRFSEMATKIRDLIQAGEIGDLRSIRLIYIWDCHGKYVREDRGEGQGARGEGKEESENRSDERSASPQSQIENRKSQIPSPPVVHASTNPDTHGRRLNLRRDRFMREGGPMIDCGVHQIDLARWWTNSEIQKFTAHGAIIDDDYNVPDHVYIHANHANGVHTMIESAFSYGHTAATPQVQYRFEAIGTNGVICFNRDTKTFTLATPAGTTHFPFDQEKDFTAMYAQFQKAIETGDPGPFATAEDGIIATRIARAAVEAIAAR